MKIQDSPIVLYEVSQRKSPDCDCDCACENSLPSRLSNMEIHGEWITSPHAYPISRLGEWTTVYNSKGPLAISVLNDAALELWQSFSKPKDVGSLAPADIETARSMAWIGLLHNPNLFISQHEPVSKTLSAWLHLTNACNLRCDYCYLNKTSDGMSREVAFESVKTLFDSAQKHLYSALKIKYAGGEPFIRFNLLADIHEEAKRYEEIYHIELKEVVISNGTLLKEKHIKYLQKENVRLSISLDGIGAVHDRQRAYRNGKGSFKEIEQSLLLCKDMGYSPDITITVTDRNAEHLSEITEYLLNMSLHFNFNFYRENDCSMSFRDLKFGEEKIIQGIKKAYRTIEKNLPEWSLLGAIADRSSFAVPHNHTCSVGRDYMVIDHHGNIAKCQMTIGVPITTIHSADPLMEIRNDKTGIQNLSVEEKEGCKTCEWKNWCTGGCSLATYRATGRYDVKSPNCNVYKAIYPELLRLESLRLIKYGAEGTVAS